jgi:hypothetical protein
MAHSRRWMIDLRAVLLLAFSLTLVVACGTSATATPEATEPAAAAPTAQPATQGRAYGHPPGTCGSARAHGHPSTRGSGGNGCA